ncbi:FliA/WhiG family RNA polymerase sigma factor [bacterium (Candidatus Blackallbacteria) CG17_big_fil_post_rev_8_21_14_2_50_48_46]|uniref:FliA/WhiG family RNA polymerase sigma factor n=1 Tax=bacterium (Candidatus Blackallbacteria) CG17_big_fil_post_rev_8_21_14_2_50_48_46 TaxID=2014261 RepID=A0A2M7G3Z3_9BACT|nr:MAG: FliA/WhiG family RNA polymerase sigma factor [bacterium (Candidatus Blackallbacteria) CG18_big_fil_WC_8_21_14_2_50_49_26]PIW16573.1 MAG: FliA/WhiG family RNA polymerase sigma factor [bacterium (Candidatus Blackallbacteria) CG17_big_fil_post_rev_8_21_14_2_50_48_46]PIW46081.1 MAG: FliA/WhiG family RNA polymerase sigma factor [bacterium (Candidatus Blackallbacteria) CG13_big_fil_rev_8_21_14_2_50_49_14]
MATMSNLTPEEIASSWEAYLKQGQADARDRLIRHYLYLVRYAVSRMLVQLPTHLDSDDLIGYGLLGLIQSVEKFDPERKVRFETYAMTRIRGAILDELRAMDWMPRSLRRKAREVEKAIHRIENRTGKPAQEEDLALELGIELKQLHQILNDTSYLVVSLDYLLSAGSHLKNWEESLPDTRASSDPTREIDRQAMQEALQEALRSLPEREQKLVSLYYFEGLTMKEIGQVLELTEARICQIHAQAVHRLKARMHDLLLI